MFAALFDRGAASERDTASASSGEEKTETQGGDEKNEAQGDDMTAAEALKYYEETAVDALCGPSGPVYRRATTRAMAGKRAETAAAAAEPEPQSKPAAEPQTQATNGALQTLIPIAVGVVLLLLGYLVLPYFDKPRSGP